jgi:hypothetical protein
MKLTIYAKTFKQLSQFVDTFNAKYQEVNFIERKDTFLMNTTGTIGNTIPWREGHCTPNQADPNRRKFYKFLEI